MSNKTTHQTTSLVDLLKTPQQHKLAEPAQINAKQEISVFAHKELAKLEPWLAAIERIHFKPPHQKENSSSTELATQLLSRFGIKNAADALIFLKSPAGETLKAMIIEYAEEIKSTAERNQREAMEALLKKHSMKIHFILGMLYRKEAHAKWMHETLQKQADKVLGKGETKATKTPSTHENDLQLEYAALNSMDESLKTHYDDIVTKEELLEQELMALKTVMDEMTKKYTIFENDITKLFKLIDTTSDSDISQKLGKIKEQINQYSEQVNHYLENGQETEARALLHQINGLHLQQIGLQDLLAPKLFYSEHGQRINSYKDAAFILPMDKKLIKENGHFYLLNTHQDFELMKNNPAELAKARLAFEQARPHISDLKSLLQSNKALENTELASNEEQLENRCVKHHDHCLAILEQRDAIDSAKQKHRTHPRPSLVAQPTQDAEQVNQQVAAIKNMLTPMQARPQPSAIRKLLETLMQSSSLKADQALYKELYKNLAAIKPFAPIQPQTMQSLLATLERFGVPAYRPGVSPTPSPLSMKLKPPGSL